MTLLRGTIIPRILLGVFGLLALLMAWGSLKALYAYGVSPRPLILLLFSLSLSSICFSVALGFAPFRIRE